MIAIDMDGTFAEWPRELEILSRSMPCVVLTGTVIENYAGWVPYNAAIAARMTQVAEVLQRLGVKTIPPIVVCAGSNSSEIAKKKSDWCRDNGVSIFIDDSDDYCESVRAACPSLLILKVWP